MNQYNAKYKRGESVLVIHDNSVKRFIVHSVRVEDSGITTFEAKDWRTTVRISGPIQVSYEFKIPLNGGFNILRYNEEDVFNTIEELIANFKTIEK